MLLVARKNLFSERVRLAISVGGVALSVFLIGILLSLFRGWNEQVGGFVEKTPADLWVASDGTTDFLAASSALPDALAGRLRFVPEIDVVSPVIVRPMELYKSGGDPDDTFDIQLVGYDPAYGGLGGPIEVIEGKDNPAPGEIIIDEETSRRYDVHIADRVLKGTKSLTVAGIAKYGDFVYTQVAFVRIDTAVDFINLEPATLRTFILLTLHDPDDRASLAHRLEVATPGARYVTPEDFADETRSRILGNILPILIVVLIVAFIVGLSVAGLTIYTATVEKSREYGILKAEGFTNPFLYRVVFEQSMITGILGFLIGAGVTILAAPFAQDTVPQFVVFVRWQDIVGIAGITLLMALIAAYIPVRRIASIDPVTVFKG
jgi:putative ABC transport system permease protein